MLFRSRHDLQIILFNNSNKNNHLCLNCIFPNKDDVNLPRCDVAGISGISAGLAGLIAAQKIINFYLNLKDETNIMTISDGKKLSIDNIVIKSKHDCYLNSIFPGKRRGAGFSFSWRPKALAEPTTLRGVGRSGPRSKPD